MRRIIPSTNEPHTRDMRRWAVKIRIALFDWQEDHGGRCVCGKAVGLAGFPGRGEGPWCYPVHLSDDELKEHGALLLMQEGTLG